MGGCYARDRNVFNRGLPERQLQSRQVDPVQASPRDVRFSDQTDSVGYEAFSGASPRNWQWNSGVLKVARRDGNKPANYKRLSVSAEVEEEAEEEEEDDGDRIVRRPSQSQMEWVDEWLESVESGELDVYTCLGLSNAFTWTPDTRKLLAKVAAVTVLQIVIPCIMLFLETVEGLTIEPAVEGKGFRAIGSALYLYSVYSMYNNALDECRSRLLNFVFHFKLPAGYWAPLLLGEISNVLVSIVLVITLYIIYTHLTVPADLILNAVAVNFLGSVDAEFVNEDMKKDALVNFRELTSDILSNPSMNTEKEKDEEMGNTLVDKITHTVLYGIAFSGMFLSIVFFFAPTADHVTVIGCNNAGGGSGPVEKGRR